MTERSGDGEAMLNWAGLWLGLGERGLRAESWGWFLADRSSGRCSDRRSRGTRRRWLLRRPVRRRRRCDVDRGRDEQSVEDVRLRRSGC